MQSRRCPAAVIGTRHRGVWPSAGMPLPRVSGSILSRSTGSESGPTAVPSDTSVPGTARERHTPCPYVLPDAPQSRRSASPSSRRPSRPMPRPTVRPPHRQRVAAATAAARWQGSQLKKGRIHTSGFDDWGLTIDSAFALVADGGSPAGCTGSRTRSSGTTSRTTRSSRATSRQEPCRSRSWRPGAGQGAPALRRSQCAQGGPEADRARRCRVRGRQGTRHRQDRLQQHAQPGVRCARPGPIGRRPPAGGRATWSSSSAPRGTSVPSRSPERRATRARASLTSTRLRSRSRRWPRPRAPVRRCRGTLCNGRPGGWSGCSGVAVASAAGR